MRRSEQNRLALSKVVVVIAAVFGVIGVIWLAWFNPLPLKHTIDSFDECVKAGHPVQESYPEVCVTPDGQRFTGPGSEQKYLTIEEWGVRFPYPNNVRNLGYAINGANSNLADIKLNDVPGDCKGMNTLRRAQAGQDLDGKGTTPEMYLAGEQDKQVKKLDDYFYLFAQNSISCLQGDQERLEERIKQLSSGLEGEDIQKLEEY